MTATNAGTYADQAIAGSITRPDTTPVFPQEILDYLVDQNTITQSDVDNAKTALRS